MTVVQAVDRAADEAVSPIQQKVLQALLRDEPQMADFARRCHGRLHQRARPHIAQTGNHHGLSVDPHLDDTGSCDRLRIIVAQFEIGSPCGSQIGKPNARSHREAVEVGHVVDQALRDQNAVSADPEGFGAARGRDQRFRRQQ